MFMCMCVIVARDAAVCCGQWMCFKAAWPDISSVDPHTLQRQTETHLFCVFVCVRLRGSISGHEVNCFFLVVGDYRIYGSGCRIYDVLIL